MGWTIRASRIGHTAYQYIGRIAEGLGLGYKKGGVDREGELYEAELRSEGEPSVDQVLPVMCAIVAEELERHEAAQGRG
ncbi:MAG: hypothetical protein ABIE22_02605, partial [archaeon]